MCQITEKFMQEGIELGNKEGERKKAKEIALNLAKRGIEIEAIAEIVNENIFLVKQWLDGVVLTEI